MKPVDLKSSTYIDFDVDANDKGTKFQVGDYVRISKYKNIFTKGCTPNWSKEVFVIKIVENMNILTYKIWNTYFHDYTW